MKKLKTLLVFVVIFTASDVYSQQLTTFFSKADSFFKTYVSNGSVAYKSIKEDPEALNELMELAQTISVSTTEATSYQAFWINAYNLAVIKGIISNYPISSPLDKKGFFDRTTYAIAGSKITLNDIENKKLRNEFGDPRFHFVLVCGARGCPPLISMGYTPDNLEGLLQQQTEVALNNPKFIQVKGSKVAISEIFKWYKEDFRKDGNTIDYINKYRKEKISDDADVIYYEYDWRLNSN